MNDLSMGPGELLQRLAEERLLLSLGQLPKTAVNTLIGYAYAQKPTVRANLVFDRDLENDFQCPKFIYQIEIKQKLRYRIARWAIARQTLLGKLLALLMVMLGAPMGLAETVRGLAAGFLPGNFMIEVQICPFPLSKIPAPEGSKPVTF